MKRIFATMLALFAASTFAATLNPVGLLNPAGSTAGQGVVSTGPSTAPVWGSVAISTLTGILPVANGGTGSAAAAGARTNLGLGTSSTVNTGTSGATVPLLSTANTWTLAQTFTVGPFAPTAAVGTNTTQVATTAFVQANAVTSNSPTITTPNIVGVTNGSNAASGSVGEYGLVTAALTSTSSGTVNNLAQLSLPPGDYLVWGWIHYLPAGTTTMQGRLGGISTTSGTVGPAGSSTLLRSTLSPGLDESFSTPTIRVNATGASTPVYLISNVVFTTSTMQVEGKIYYQRIR